MPPNWTTNFFDSNFTTNVGPVLPPASLTGGETPIEFVSERSVLRHLSGKKSLAHSTIESTSCQLAESGQAFLETFT